MILKLLPAADVEILHLRKYEELSVEILLQRALNDPTMKKFIPNLPDSHPLNKTYLLAVSLFL